MYLCIFNYFIMKNSLLVLLLLCAGIFATAQTAPDFSCNDCNDTPHNLYAELDNGKVIILCWVMPCPACVGPALTTYNVVQSFAADNSDKVQMYLCDDYANTSCKALKSWANANQINQVTFFSDATIKMLDYGSNGMPKIVVIGGTDHTVFYNANNTVEPNALLSAITNALSIAHTNKMETTAFSMTVSPNPAQNKAEVSFTLPAPAEVKIELYNLGGKMLQSYVQQKMNSGENSIQIPVHSLPTGVYLISLSDGNKKQFKNFIKQ